MISLAINIVWDFDIGVSAPTTHSGVRHGQREMQLAHNYIAAFNVKTKAVNVRNFRAIQQKHY